MKVYRNLKIYRRAALKGGQLPAAEMSTHNKGLVPLRTQVNVAL
jgi:hypothetical protein